MKNKKLDKVWSERHIPEELSTEILCRLPVKSLLRFRCVSTSWLALIDNAEFARLHLKNFKNNCDEAHLLAVERRRRNCVVRCSDTFETISETLLSLGNDYFQGAWEFVCSMDGLVLLKWSRVVPTATIVKDLKVWNPSIRKFHEIPSFPTIETPPDSDSYLMDKDIGLGYDPLANDYKHVKLIRVDHNTSVAVYSLGAGSWKIIPFQGKGYSWHWNLMSIERNKKVYLRGSLYFTASDDDNSEVGDLVSFDLSSEVFSSIRLPFFYWQSRLTLIDGGCSIAMLNTCSPHNFLWVLESSSDESEPMCWTKRYSFHLKYNQFLYIKKNGDMLTRRCLREYLTGETGKKLVQWDQVASYSPETEEYKIVQERKGSFHLISHVSAYVESLILLK